MFDKINSEGEHIDSVEKTVHTITTATYINQNVAKIDSRWQYRRGEQENFHELTEDVLFYRARKQKQHGPWLSFEISEM